ncbi:conserved hypothetical protein [uncultured delta proteobacterium]|uniref:Radical SAM core domain-containing protein n=1 Tax=uncultured delta proteobacterium TaxID=34034 RepID=A0A212JVA0_9DELT|nr:conserved hypothetical protein [uncultured delta proteobacterium]
MPAARPLSQPLFLPMTREEMDALGWEELDILLVSGDAYVDHPSFGTALLGRYLVDRGFRVGVAAQPRWEGDAATEDIARMGRPRLFAGVTAGAIDSMLARYTAFRKQRSDDAYTPGGQAGKRPNRAVIVYANLVRRAFPGLPVVIGGIEASLRRAAHYDFWTDSLRRSILLDSKADVLVYGMGETALEGVAHAAEDAVTQAGQGFGQENAPVRALFAERVRKIPGTAWAVAAKDADMLLPADTLRLPSFEAIEGDPFLLVAATVAMERQVHQGKSPAAQASGDRVVVMNPPVPPLTTAAMDALYALPYSRLPHPSYTDPIPAWEMIRSSITSHRGCGGGCAFCSLALHQTRHIASRGKESILGEARRIAATTVNGKVPAWAGSISDIGGPSANMWQAACTSDATTCGRASCLFPAVCPFFSVDQAKGAAMLREAGRQEGVRHVRVASGVRFDLALADDAALQAYTQEFTGGQLKIAPEHIAEDVLRLMRKPSRAVFEKFLERFGKLSGAAGKEQYVIPYLMSAYPGCTDAHMRELAAWLKQRNWSPRQVQCFIPTPGTVATAMYYAGKDVKGEPIPVARTDADRMRQHYILLGQEKGGRPFDGKGGREERRFGAEKKGRGERDEAPHTKRNGEGRRDRGGRFSDGGREKKKRH